MRCRRAQRFISEHVDGTLDPGREASLGRHLERCADCRAFLQDLRAIVGDAKNLEKLVPQDSIWLKIRTHLRHERSVAHVEDSGKWRAFSFAPSRLHFAVASALAVILVIASVLLYSQPWNKGLPAEQAALDRQTLEKLNEAEWHFQQAIGALSEVVIAQQGEVDPEVNKVFQANLKIVDASLEACRKTLRRAPRDLDAQYALMASYKQKVQLLSDWALAQRPAEAEEPEIRL